MRRSGTGDLRFIIERIHKEDATKKMCLAGELGKPQPSDWKKWAVAVTMRVTSFAMAANISLRSGFRV